MVSIKASKIISLAMLPVTVMGAMGVASHFFPEWLEMNMSLSTGLIMMAVAFVVTFVASYLGAKGKT